MSGQYELGPKHTGCLNKAKELISEITDENNPKQRVKEYLTKIDTTYDDYLGMAVVLEEIAKQDSVSAYILADQFVFNEIMKSYGSCSPDTVVKKGETIGLLCLEPGYTGIQDIQTKAVKTANGWQVQGVKLISNEQIYSDKYLIFAKDEEGKIRLFPVIEDDIKINETKKSISCSDVILNQAEINLEIKDDTCIGLINDNYEKVQTIARTLIAAVAVGIGHSALINSIQTAKETKNHAGQSISTSQSLQFTLADMFAEIEGARMLTYYSADNIDKGKPNIKIASMAKVKASEAAASAAMKTLHILGNIGFIANKDTSLIQRAVDSQIKGGTNRIQKAQIYEYMLAKK